MMESPINLSCDPPLKSAENHQKQLSAPYITSSSSSSSSSLSSSSSSLSSSGSSSYSSLQAKPSRFRYPLVSLKRLKTLGPARRVLVSDTEVDNSLPKISEEENAIAQKKSFSDENVHVEVSAESPSTGNCSLQQEKAVPGLDLGRSCAFEGIAGNNYELQEPRKRKGDIETMAEEATISLTVNMESSTNPSENNTDLRLGQKGCDYIGTGEFDSVGIAHKSMAEHNIPVNRHSAHYDVIKLYASNADIEEAACSKSHLKQLQKLDIAALGSDHLKPIMQAGPKKVHFAHVDSNRVGSVEFPNSPIIETEHKSAHSTFYNQQVVLNSRSSLEVSTDDRTAPSSSSIKDDSIHSKHYPALMSEYKNKENFVTRGQFVDYDLALGSTDFLKSECNFSNVDVKPSMSYRTHLSSTTDVNRLLDSLSSTPLVSVNSESCEKLTTDTHVEDLSSHLNSLALTENRGNGSLRKLGESFHTHLENLKQAGPSNGPKFQSSILKQVQSSKTNIAATAAVAIDEILKPRVNYSSRVEVNNSSTLPATADLSCRASSFCVSNSASIQCTSALSSLSSFQNHGPCKDLSSAREKGTVAELSSNSRLEGQNFGFNESEKHFNLNINNSSGSSASAFTCTSSSFACQSATSIRCTSGPLTSLSAGHGLNMSREHSGTVKVNTGKSLSEEPNNVNVREPRVLTKPIEERASQEPCLASRTNEARSRVPEVASGLNKSVNQSACGGESGKALDASSKETNNSRKKHHDPDAFFRVNNKIYQKLGKIGSGGSSEVHKVISSDCTIYALKKIKLKGRDYSTAYGFTQEIDYLTRLRGKNYIIQLIDYEVTDKNLFRDVVKGDSKIRDGKINEDAYIYMVLEYGEIDLAQMLLQKWREMDSGNKQIDENWLRFYWQQILKAVNTIHEERIVHSDLKPANFLLVKGVLKLIDFGIAKAIQSDTTNIQRDAQVGTLNYMSPEAFLCNDQDEDGNVIKCGRSSDIWSLGCILYQMVYGRTPFAEYTTFWAKYKEITNKNHKITYGRVSNPWLLDIMKKCLVWDRNERLRIPKLLEHPFLQPQAPPLLLTQEECYCKALVEMSDAYEYNSEIGRLCEKLLLDIMKERVARGWNERLGIPQLPEHSFLQQGAAPLSLAQEERHQKALVKISNAYESNSEICRLCEKLQEHIMNLSKSLKSSVFHSQFTSM